MPGSLPDFLIIGVAKCGTTAFAAELDQHPDVFVVGGEPKFFTRNWEQGLDWYRTIFAEAEPHQRVGEKTPGYLADGEAMERIAATIPRARLVVLVRDPTRRLLSHLNHRMSVGTFPPVDVVDEAWVCREVLGRPYRYDKYVRRGFYLEMIERHVLPLFDSAQLIVRATDEVRDSIGGSVLAEGGVPGVLAGDVASPAYDRVVADILHHVGAPPRQVERRLVRGVRPWRFRVTDDAWETLRQAYRGRNRGLSELVGRPLDWE